jgi:ferredoxin-type protein NapH
LQRYWILAATLGTAFATGSIAWELVNPVSIIYRGILFGLGMGWILIAAIFLYDLFVTRHGWCGHLCPVGAFYALIGSASLLRISARHRSRCNDCADCYRVCPEPQVLAPALKQAGSPVIGSGICTNCARCIDVCNRDVFRFAIRFDHRSD